MLGGCSDIGGILEGSASKQSPVLDELTPPPVPLPQQVAELRAEAVQYTPSAEVGAIPGTPSVGLMGVAKYDIPIDVSPGPRGMQPTVGLHYNGNAGNGLVGMGFSIGSLSTIERCARTIAEDGESAPLTYLVDPLCYEGARLVLEDGTYGGPDARYRVQGRPGISVQQSGFGTDDGRSCFNVRMHNGNISSHCATLRSKVDHGLGAGPQQIPRMWSIKREDDRYGNYIQYTYYTDEANGAQVALRPHTIVYGHDGEATSREVTFEYNERPADDVHTGYIDPYSPFRLAHVLSRISTFGPGGEVLRHYDLGYEQDPSTRHLHLTSIQAFDADGAGLPPTVIEWTNSTLALATYPYYEPPPPEEGEEEEEELLIEDRMFGTIEHTFDVLQGVNNHDELRNPTSGDFDGDGLLEVISYDHNAPGIGWRQYHTGGNESVGTGNAFLGFTGLGWMPAPAEQPNTNQYGLLHDPYELNGDHGIQNAYKAGTRARPLVSDISGDGLADWIVFAGPIGEQNFTDSFGVPAATRIQAALSIDNGVDGFAVIEIDDGSDDYIYSAIPMDVDNNSVGDFVMCRGPAYKSGRWVFAIANSLHLNGGQVGFTFHETDVGCSAHDEFGLVDLVDGHALRVIPAYGTTPSGLNFLPQDFESPGHYQQSYQALQENLRGNYRVLEFNGGAGALRTTSLTRDTFQRWHDRACYNGVAVAYENEGLGNLGPVFGAGMSEDVHIDLDGDGYKDLLRLVLTSGDGMGNIAAIRAGVGEWQPQWSTDPVASVRCAPQAGETAAIEAWMNNGHDFEYAGEVFAFAGEPHPSMWMNFKRALRIDRNFDGRTDLVLPGIGQDPANIGLAGPFVYLRSGVGHAFHPEDIDLPSGWPAYDGQWNWQDELVSTLQHQMFLISTSIQDVGIGFHGPAIPAQEHWPLHPLNFYWFTDDPSANEKFVTPFADRIRTITDGVGLVTEFTYAYGRTKVDTAAAFPALPIVHQRPMVETMTHGESVSRHGYKNCMVDALGRGVLGCEETIVGVGSAPGGNSRRVLERFDLSYDPLLNDYPKRGLPTTTWTETEVDATHEITRTDIVQEVRVQNLSGGSLVFVFPQETINQTWEFVGGVPLDPDFVEGDCVSGPFKPDTLGVPFSADDCDDAVDNMGFDAVTVTTASVTNVDDYGTVVLEEIVAKPSGHDVSSATWTRSKTHSNLLNDPDTWIIGKPQKTTTTNTDPDGNVLSHVVDFVYDPGTGALLERIQNPDYPAYEIHDVYGLSPAGIVVSHTQTTDGIIRTNAYTPSDDHVFINDATVTGRTSYFVHDPLTGQRTATVTPAGVTTHKKFDRFGRQTELSRSDAPMGLDEGWKTTNEFLPPVNIYGLDCTPYCIRRHSTDGSWVVEKYDSLDRVVRETWPGMAIIDINDFRTLRPPGSDDIYVDHAYDWRGNRTSSTLPTYVGEEPIGSTVWAYDGNDRVTQVTHPDASTEHWAYTSHGRQFLHPVLDGPLDFNHRGYQTTYTDQSGNETIFQHDVVGHELRVRDGSTDLTWTEAEYSVLGMVQVTTNSAAPEGEQRVQTMDYNYLLQLEEVHDATQGLRTYEWDNRGNLESFTNAFLDTTTYVRDDFGRVTTRITPEGNDTFSYDVGPNALGKLVQTTSSSGVTENFSYDSFQRLSDKLLQTGVDKPILNFQYEYDNQGRNHRTVFPELGGAPVVFETLFDSIGKERITIVADTTEVLWAWVQGNEPDSSTFESFGAHMGRTVLREPLNGNVLGITVAPAGGPGSALFNESYSWTARHDLESRTDLINGQTESYVYDALRRLEQVTTVSGGMPDIQTTTYNAFGDILEKSGRTYYYDAFDRLIQIDAHAPATYDINGNLLEWHDDRGTSVLTYRSNGRANSVTRDGATQQYVYSADENSVLRVDADGSEVTTYDGFELRLDANENIESMHFRFRGGGRTVGEIRRVPDLGGLAPEGAPTQFADTRIFFHADHLGSTVAQHVIENDVVTPYGEAVSYDAWGNARPANDWLSSLDAGMVAQMGGTPGFTGWHKAELEGLYINMGHRLYDGYLGRFIAPDPLAGGSHSQGRNLYSYARNNPLNWADPDGRKDNGGSPGFNGLGQSDSNEDCVDPTAEFCRIIYVRDGNSIMEPGVESVDVGIAWLLDYMGGGPTRPASNSVTTDASFAAEKRGIDDDQQRAMGIIGSRRRSEVEPKKQMTPIQEMCAGSMSLICQSANAEKGADMGSQMILDMIELGVCATPGGGGGACGVAQAVNDMVFPDQPTMDINGKQGRSGQDWNEFGTLEEAMAEEARRGRRSGGGKSTRRAMRATDATGASQFENQRQGERATHGQAPKTKYEQGVNQALRDAQRNSRR